LPFRGSFSFRDALILLLSALSDGDSGKTGEEGRMSQNDRMFAGIEVHPLADIFPPMSEAEFANLKDDIAEHGVREPVWLHQGQLVDGRHRWRACAELAIECPRRDYQGDNVLAFVVSLNLARRHLSESQRAMVAARLANMPQGARTDLASIDAMSQAQAAEMLNVSRPSVQRARDVIDHGATDLVAAVQAGVVSVSAAADVSTLPVEQQTELVARGERGILEAAKKIRAVRAEHRRAERIERIATIARGNSDLDVDQRYAVIYADPPWRYEHIETESRAIENQYPTMSHGELCALPVSDCATEDAVLFLWATSPKLAEAMRLIESWGFNYRTCAVWDKEVIGMGYYFRQQHELLLVATRGNLPPPAPSDRLSSVFRIKRAEHSAKPDEIAAAIESMYPTLPKLEMFARRQRGGWSLWGNQAREAA
jgi:N6-adenosine-specific RNA methylase IME4